METSSTTTRKHQLPELVECIRMRIGRVPGLYSLILYGSLVREDFLPGISDVDFFIVLEDNADPDTVISQIKPVLEECSAHLNPVEVDIAWEWLSNLRDPLRLGYPYKFLTIYQADFRENHIVILGNEILEYLPRYSVSEVLPVRLEGIINGLERFRGNTKDDSHPSRRGGAPHCTPQRLKSQERRCFENAGANRGRGGP